MLFHAATFTAFLGALSGAHAAVKALDLSSPQGTSVWTCVQGQSFVKGVPRLYQEACGVGLRVSLRSTHQLTHPEWRPHRPRFHHQLQPDPGIRDHEYRRLLLPMYPPTSSTRVSHVLTTSGTGSAHSCKTPQAQVAEIVAYLQTNSINVKRLWIDFEPPSAGSPCQGWNYGSTQNTVLARQFIAAIKATGLKWGVVSVSGRDVVRTQLTPRAPPQYANGNQWATMFGTRSVNIAADLPLWAVQWDGVATLGSVNTFMGGWTTAFAKQYGQSSGGCAGAGAFDLNVFTE